jgi:hypothetical protein
MTCIVAVLTSKTSQSFPTFMFVQGRTHAGHRPTAINRTILPTLAPTAFNHLRTPATSQPKCEARVSIPSSPECTMLKQMFADWILHISPLCNRTPRSASVSLKISGPRSSCHDNPHGPTCPTDASICTLHYEHLNPTLSPDGTCNLPTLQTALYRHPIWKKQEAR